MAEQILATKEDHIMAIVQESRTPDEAKERIRQFVEPDYIPKNSRGFDCPMQRHGSKDIGEIQPAAAGMRCAAVTGDDIQSGPFYCGKPAVILGWSKSHPEVYYVMCARHARGHSIELPKYPEAT